MQLIVNANQIEIGSEIGQDDDDEDGNRYVNRFGAKVLSPFPLSVCISQEVVMEYDYRYEA